MRTVDVMIGYLAFVRGFRDFGEGCALAKRGEMRGENANDYSRVTRREKVALIETLLGLFVIRLFGHLQYLEWESWVACLRAVSLCALVF